jgi:hypothetical protein
MFLWVALGVSAASCQADPFEKIARGQRVTSINASNGSLICNPSYHLDEAFAESLTVLRFAVQCSKGGDSHGLKAFIRFGEAGAINAIADGPSR